MGSIEQKIDFNTARKWLATVWLALAGLIFLIFIFWTTATDKLGDRAAEAWGWVLPTVIPTLSLIIGILVTDIGGKSSEGKLVSKFIYRLAMGLSIFYLVVILVILLFHGTVDKGLFTILKEANLFLGPLQGLVSAAIGGFYYKKE